MKKKILVIEDETIFCKLISKWLENNGYTVFTAQDGEAGLELIREDKPDLVLVDTLLPGMDGLQVSREIRLTDTTSALPIILMSAIYKDLQFVTQAKKIANDFIEKPFKEIELIRKINKLLPSEDDIIPPSPSYMVSMEAEKSKEMSDKMESDLVVEVNKTEIQPGSNKITIDIPTHEPEMLKESQPTGERAEEGGEPTKEFHIHLQDAENNQDEESNEEIKVSKAILDSTTSHKKSQSIESIQKELDALFKMTKKK